MEELNNNTHNEFDEWFKIVKKGKEIHNGFMIPFEDWLDEYIDNIGNRSEDDVKELLRYLLSPYTRRSDQSSYKILHSFSEQLKDEQDSEQDNERDNIFKECMKNEYYKRIENKQEAWEGLTWILQLLPFSPYKAIRALNSYFDAEVMCMPDDRIIGIQQCIAIIEAKFINMNKGLENCIFDLKPREFELLIGSLYESLGYEIEITPATRDGGKDIIARINREDGKEVVYVECKLYKTTELRIDNARALLGTIYQDNINRGVLFCTGYVNKNIKKFNPRIQVWTLEEIIILLNAHLGSDWDKRLNRLIDNQKIRHK